MKTVKIKIYRSQPTESRNQRVLVRTMDIKVNSDKPLTALRASKILKREVSEFECAGSVIVIETEEGWEASRTVKPSKKCEYHYIWEYAVISE